MFRDFIGNLIINACTTDLHVHTAKRVNSVWLHVKKSKHILNNWERLLNWISWHSQNQNEVLKQY